MIPAIIAPVRWRLKSGEECWIGVSFAPGQSSNEPATPSQHVTFTASFKPHLNRLKTSLGVLTTRFNVPSEKRQQVTSACPRVDLVSTRLAELKLPVILSIEEQRSWELAYVLCCLAGADLGVWENRNYWATGAVDGDQISIDPNTLDDKVGYVASQHGRSHFFVPTGNSLADNPPTDVTITNVTALPQLFADPTSPLSRQLLDPRRFSNLGVPTILEDSSHPETFQTRTKIKDELLATLRNLNNRLILISSPIGWGKTTLLTSALREYSAPVYVSDFARVLQELEAADCLLKGIKVTDDESADIENDISYVAAKLKSRLPANTLLVFLNTSLNPDHAPSLQVQQLIASLVGFGFRCVIEMWDLEGWQQRGYTTSKKEITSADIPPLSDKEVLSWLGMHDLIEAEILDAFSLLDGHPLGIEFTIGRVETARKFHPVDPGLILEAAISWEKDQTISSYLQRIDKYCGQELPPKTIEWFALFHDRELPGALIESPDHERQLQFGVRIGLLSPSPKNSGYRAFGWFSLYCIEKLSRTGLQGGILSLDWSLLEPIDALEYERLKRHLMEVAAYVPQAREQIKRLAMTTPEAIVEASQPINEYIAPNTQAALAVIVPEAGNIDEIIWALEQSCRARLFTKAQEHWETLMAPELEQRIVSKLQKDWLALRSLSLAYRASSRKVDVSFPLSLRLLEILGQLHVSKAGHCSYLAYTALAIADDFSAAGNKDGSRKALHLATAAIDQLREPPTTDHRYSSWLELKFRLQRALYVTSANNAQAQERLSEIIDITERGIALNARSYSWQRRYFRYLSEVVEITGENREIQFNAAIVTSLFDSEPFDLLEQFLTVRFRMLSDAQTTARNELDKLLAGLTKAKWKTVESLNREPQTRQEFFSLRCGLILSIERASKITQRILEQVWAVDSDVAIPFADEHLKLTALCLRVTVPEPGQQLLGELRAIKKPRIMALTKGATEATLTQFWRAYLDYRARSCRAKFVDISRQQGLALISAAIGLQRTTSLENDMDALFDQAMKERPADRPQILTLKYDFHVAAWQAELHFKRSIKGSRSGFGDLFPSKSHSVLGEMDRICPNDALTWRCKALFFRYVWQLEEACQAAERAYFLARYARKKRQSLWLLAQIFVTWVYSPEILRTQRTPVAGEDVIRRFNTCASELVSIWPERELLFVFRDGLRGDAAFWQKVISEVEERLGTPEEFWDRLTEAAVIQDPKDQVQDVLADLTDSEVLKMVSKALKWASQKAEFEGPLRLKLAEMAIVCIYAARGWNRGSLGNYSISDDYALATAIVLALIETKDGSILGSEVSPISTHRGRYLTWKEAAEIRLRRVRADATGGFREHVDTIWSRFQQH